MAVAFDAFSNVAAGTGNLSWTHTPVGTPRGVKVDIVENGGSNGISSVTYGGVAMELAAVNTKTSGEAGTVITYFLGKNIPTGAQTVSITVSDSVSKRAAATTVTAATDTCWLSADISIGSDSITNPSSTLNLLGKTCFVSLAGHSGQGAVTGTAPTTGWTSRLEYDFGAQVACWYTYDTVSTSNVACGWTQTADDAVMVALAIAEAPLSIDTNSVQITESASVAVVFDARALPILLIESASVTIVTAIAANDICAVQADEVGGFGNNIYNADDTCSALISEDSVVTKSFTVEDVCAGQLSESSTKDEFTPASQQALPIGLTDGASVTAIAVFLEEVATVGLSDLAALDSTAAVFGVSDSCSIGFAEQVPFFSVADTASIGVEESRPVVITDGGESILTVIDSCSVQSSESVSDLLVFIPGTIQNFVVTDSLKVQLNGEAVPPAAKSASDSLRVVAEEPSDQSSHFAVQDELTIQEADTATAIFEVSAHYTVADSLGYQLTESAQVGILGVVVATDSLRVQAPEDVPETVVAIASSDSLRVTSEEPSDQYTQFGVVDSLTAQASAEVIQIGGLLTFTASDGLTCGLNEVTNFGTASVSATDSCGIICSEVLINSSAVVAIESLLVALSEVATTFKSVSIDDSITVQFADSAFPIFNSFIDLTAGDLCAVQVDGSVTELVSFLTQITTTDSCGMLCSENLLGLFVESFAGDQVSLGIDDLLSVFASLSVVDSLGIGTVEAGLAIPIVSVNVSTFASDVLLGVAEGAASVDVIYESVERSVTDSYSVQVLEAAILQLGLFAEDDYLVGVGESASDMVVANTTPDTWNGVISTEHGRQKPRPTKYQFSETRNW